MAAQAATIRLLLHIPPDAFTDGDEPAIDRIRAALEMYRAESVASIAILRACADWRRASQRFDRRARFPVIM
jgi:hypothetical protein